MQTQCTVLAKVVVNKKLNMYRVLFTFDKYNKLTVKNCVLATGDICATDNSNADMYIEQAIKKAVKDLSCAGAQIVD